MQTIDNLRCAINPLSGREAELTFDSKRKKVVIIGGGTGGLEAARLAAVAGHQVILLERQRRLGGSLLLASTVHSDNETFFDWLLAEIKRFPIEIRTGIEANVELIKAEKADAIIVSTGAIIETPEIAGIDNAQILTGALMRQIASGTIDSSQAHRIPSWLKMLVQTAVPLLENSIKPKLLRRASRYWMPLGKTVIIIGADLAALELAEFIAQRGRRVHLLETAKKIAPEVGKKRRQEHMNRLDQLKITINTSVTILRIETKAVIIAAGGLERTINGDTIIVAGRVAANTALTDSLKEAGLPVQAIGDCTGLGLIAKATHTAAEAVNNL